MSEPARAALMRATSAMRRYGWIAFWTQLTLSVVSGVILLFSVAFTSHVRRPAWCRERRRRGVWTGGKRSNLPEQG